MMSTIKNIFRPAGKIRFYLEEKKYGPNRILSTTDANEKIFASLVNRAPTGIAKIGATELDGIRYYLRQTNPELVHWGKYGEHLHVNAGVFPSTPENFTKFCEVYLQEITNLSMLCTWLRWGEASIAKAYAPDIPYIPLRAIDPFYCDDPWTIGLKGKKVLVISPFAESIFQQYKKRKVIWAKKPELLPDFDLRTLRCPLSAALQPPEDPSWLHTLQRLQNEISRIDFDAAIIGAGAWSLPLAAQIRKNKKWAIHLGGSTQILFGISGGRWDKHSEISQYFNSDWSRPTRSETPETAKKVEGACYW